MAYYSYRQSKRGLLTVGNYDGDDWVPESEHDSVESAMARTNFLNARTSFVNEGGTVAPDPKEPFAPTRFDRLLEAAFQGILSNRNLSETRIAHLALDHTKALMKLLEEQNL